MGKIMRIFCSTLYCSPLRSRDETPLKRHDITINFMLPFLVPDQFLGGYIKVRDSVHLSFRVVL